MGDARDRVLNTARLEEVTGGDVEFEVELLQEFLDETPGVILSLHEAVQTGNLPVVQSECHALKGSSLSLGAEELGRAASRAEDAAREGNIEAASNAVDQLETAFTGVRAAMQERITRAA